MKKSILSLALAVIMVMSLLTIGAFAEEKTVSDVNGLTAALAAADDGDTIVLEAGDYDVGTLRVQKAVNFKGAGIGQTVIIGSINYYCGKPDSVKSITVENLTVKSQANNKTDEQAIWWSYNPSNPLESVSLYVKNCEVVDYLFGIGVNSSTKNCAVYVENLKLDNVWCGANVSEGAGNTVEAYDIAAGSSVDYEIQVFGKSGAENSNTYYKTYEDCVNDPTRANPALNSNDSMPNISNGDWPAAAILNGKYYGTIQAAVDAATDDDVITIMPGTHTLADNEDITINKKVTIQGDGVSSTVVGSGSSPAGHGLFTFAAGSEGSTLKDFEINYTATGPDCAAVYFGYGFTSGSEENVTTIENIDFIGAATLNDIGQEIGILSTYMTGSNITIKNCEFHNFKYGMYFNAVNGLTVIDNIIDGTKYNAINIAGDNPEVPCSDISVSGNILRNICSGDYYSEEYSSGVRVGVNATDVHVADNSITMLNGKTPVYFDPDTSDTPVRYIVKYVSNNVVIDMYTVDADANAITLNGAPTNSGYIFLGWRSGDNTYKAGEKVAITADTIFVAVWGNLPDVKPSEPETPETPVFPFYDVTARDWYYSAVKYVYEKGLMDGVDVGVFAPNDTLTRAMVWTIIARAEGVDTTGGATWDAKAQEWVTAKGISDGENPSAAITRQELVTMLYRLAGEPAVSGNITAPDASSVSTWAQSAMTWAMNIGLVEGDENGAVTPTATATRSQAAALIMRYLEA